MILPQGFTLRFAQRGDAELVRSVTLACWAGSVALDSTAYREPVDEIAHQIETGAAVILSRGGGPADAAAGDDAEVVFSIRSLNAGGVKTLP